MEAHREKADRITYQADGPAEVAPAAVAVLADAPAPDAPAVSVAADAPAPAAAEGITYQADTPAYPSIPAVSTDHPVEAVAASVDTAKSQIHPTFTTSKQLKEEERNKKEEEAKKEKKENGVQKLKSSLLVTGVMVAVIGAIFAVVKNIKKA